MDKIELPEMLGQLHEDLLQTQTEGKGLDLQLRIEDIEIELQIVATEGETGGMGVKFWVLNADAKINASEVKSQKLKLKVKPIDSKTGGNLDVGDEDEVIG